MYGKIYEVTLFFYLIGIASLLYYLVKEREFLQKLYQHKVEILIIFGICFSYAIFISGRHLTSWDDYTFWATATKELLLNNKFDTSESNSSILQMHAHYPRGAAIYHYYFLVLGGFSEDSALLAHFLLHIIFLMPLAGNKNPFLTPLLFSLVLMSVCLYTTGTRSLYNDSTIGLMFGAMFAIYLQEKNANKSLLLALPIMIVLPMFREMGMFLAEFAAIILIYNHSRYNNKKYVSYIIMLIAPIAVSLLLNYYFEITHDFFGRTKHSFSNMTSLLENFDATKKLLLTNYIKYLSLSFIKEGAISMYVTYGLALYCLFQYKKEEIKSFKYFSLSLCIFFIFFAIWRLYLYYFTLEFTFALKGHSLARYLGSYMLAFPILSALFIKISLADTENLEKKFKLFLAALFIASSTTVIINMLRVSKNYNDYEKAINNQIAEIFLMLKQEMPVDFDYTGKKGNFWCFYINYKLAPYNKGEELEKCLNYTDAQKVIKLNKNEPKRVVYQPFLTKIIRMQD